MAARAPKYQAIAASEPPPSFPGLFAGTSGWAYPTWKPAFYPPEVPPRAFLHSYAARLNAVEVNYTFRTLPTLEQVQSWIDATPPGFRFCFKAPQRITHMQRLRNSHAAVAEFAEAIRPAQKAGKLGPVLFQLPPNFVANPALLADLLAAPELCARGKRRVPVAVEFRHPSWFTEATYAVLRHYRAALCVAESEDLVTPDVATAPFRYYRLRCPGGYARKKLCAFAETFTTHAANGEVFAFLKHEDEPTGGLNALTLIRQAAKLYATRATSSLPVDKDGARP